MTGGCDDGGVKENRTKQAISRSPSRQRRAAATGKAGFGGADGKQLPAQRLDAVAGSVRHYSVGFLGVHDGRTANFVFVDWWADENELHHHVYVSPADAPARLEHATPTGLAACVWDLRVMAFERQAWLDTVLKRAGGAGFDAYLRHRLNEDV